MEKLVQLLNTIVSKLPFLSESEKLDTENLLRDVESELGVSGVTPPAAVDANQPPVVPDVAVPGPVAEPVPAAEQTPPPTSPEVGGAATDTTNAFSESGEAPS